MENGTNEISSEETTTETQPSQVTIEDVNNIVNNAFRNRLKRFETSITDKFGEMLSAQLGPKNEEQEPGEAPANSESAVPPELAKQLKLQQKEIEKLRKTAEEAERVAQERELTVKRQEEREALRSLLVTGGVKDVVVEDLVDAQMARGIVGRDDYGDIVWKNKDEVVSLDEGVAAFLKTDRAKHYLPASEGTGSGNTGGTRDHKSKPGEMSDNDFMSHVL